VEAPELVVLFADADAERFVTTLIERGIERACLRRIRWRPVRDPMHDARVAREPTAALSPFLGDRDCRFAVLWDHRGSGHEQGSARTVEASVVAALARAGVDDDRTVAIAFEPELEAALLPVWPRVLEELGRKRGALPFAGEPDAADPKGSLARALEAHRLRASPPIFAELARALSLEQLKKGSALGRLAERLAGWFGSEA
jgi:hypothetical protein